MVDDSDLVRSIAACADELTQQVVAEMYENSFWDDRFGARGRRFSEEDGRYHLSYLGQALGAGSGGDPTILTSYAVWLRTVLVSRGMCSRHLAENFERLAAAVGARSLSGGARAVDYLQQAAAALRYLEGPAGLLQERSADLIERATAALAERHAGSPGSIDWCRDELQVQLSYLADAIAASRPELFTKHVQWCASFFERRAALQAAPRQPEILHALEQAIDSLDASELKAATAPILSAGRAALEPGVSQRAEGS